MATTAARNTGIPLKTVKGFFHQLELYSDHRVIRYYGFFSRLFSHDEVVNLKDITDFQVYTVNFMVGAWTQLVIFRRDRLPSGLSYRFDHSHDAHQTKAMIEDLRGRRDVASVMKHIKP